MAKKPGESTRRRQQRRGGTPARNRGARPSGAERTSPPAPAPATRRCDLCGEATSGAPRHASAAECFVALRQALDTAREEVTLVRGRLALVEHQASGAEKALRAVAELLRAETTPKTLPRLVARIKELIAPHAVSPSKG